jgi:hypothetical protein
MRLSLVCVSISCRWHWRTLHACSGRPVRHATDASFRSDPYISPVLPSQDCHSSFRACRPAPTRSASGANRVVKRSRKVHRFAAPSSRPRNRTSSGSRRGPLESSASRAKSTEATCLHGRTAARRLSKVDAVESERDAILAGNELRHVSRRGVENSARHLTTWNLSLWIDAGRGRPEKACGLPTRNVDKASSGGRPLPDPS